MTVHHPDDESLSHCSDGGVDCSGALHDLHLYLDGELPDRDLSSIRAHLAACYPCADRVDLRGTAARPRSATVAPSTRPRSCWTAFACAWTRSADLASRTEPVGSPYAGGLRPSDQGCTVTDQGTVLVTGGAGFIGSNLVDRLLAEGRRVIVLDDLSSGRLANLDEARRAAPGSFEFQRMDITSETVDPLVRRHRPEVIIHLAAQMNVRVSVEDPMHDARVNVLGTVNLLEAARRNDVRKVVFATSGGCIYGEPSLDELPVTEDHPGHAHSPYGASKRSGEEYLRTYHNLYGLDWTSLAFSNVYGPRQDPAGEAGVVAIFTERMLAGQPCTIFGDGEQSRDFVYVDDVVHALALAMDRGDNDRFNIGTSERTSVNQLYRALAAATNYPHEPVYAPEREGELQHSSVSIRKAAEGLGWKPWTMLEEGLASTLAWAAGGTSTASR